MVVNEGIKNNGKLSKYVVVTVVFMGVRESDVGKHHLCPGYSVVPL